MVLLAAAFASSAEPPRAMADYEKIQSLRQEADKLIDAEHPDTANLRKAEQLLQSALDYLGNADVRERAVGNRFLYGRRYDTVRDFAAVHALLGEKARALDELEAMSREGSYPGVVKLLEEDKVFASLRDEPRFKAVVAEQRLAQRLWKNPALATPYRETLPVEERIAGLSAFWAEARASFVHFDHVPALDWDKTYLEFLPQVMAAQSTRDYYDVLMRLAPLLQDGHTNIYPPEQLQRELYARPPLSTRLVDGKVIVIGVFSKKLGQRVHVGDEIVAIDGMPVERYAADRVAPYASSSTPQDRIVRTYSYQLLSGAAGQPVKLRLRDAHGRERDETIARDGYADAVDLPAFDAKMLEGGVAYFALDHLESDEGVKKFEAFLPQVLASKGLVIDLRSNGGGSTGYGLDVLSWLTDLPIPTAHQVYRGDTGLERAWGGAHVTWQAVTNDAEPFVRAHEKRFTGPVAVLIGPQTFSAGEDFAMAFDVLNRGTLIGAATGGSTGQPLSFKLPGGGTARICVKRDSYPDGREFVGTGIAPDIEVARTVEDYRRGRDPVIERARVELLKLGKR
jgi:C-terminal processing protease CtpA/Prc